MGPQPDNAAGKSSFESSLWTALHDELRRLAAAMMRGERGGHTLQPTALVNEAYLKLTDQANLANVSRSQFIAAAVVTMRRELIDHARRSKAAKRGGPQAARVSLSGIEIASDFGELDPLDIARALEELDGLDPRAASIVDLKFFGGLSHDEIAAILNLSPRTVDSEWAHARGWLRVRLASYASDSR